MGKDLRLDGFLAMPSGEPISRNSPAAVPQLHKKDNYNELLILCFKLKSMLSIRRRQVVISVIRLFEYVILPSLIVILD